MQRQRKPPSKRYSSYTAPTELSHLDANALPDSEQSQAEIENGSNVNDRRNSSNALGNSERRRSVSTLHFDALQNAVSKLSRMDDFDMEELGYGFFSDVFKVTHKQSGKIMVLKRNKSTNTKLNILREVQLMNRLAHPNILKFMGVCVHEGQLHALTEYINGGDLDQLVQQKSTYLSWAVRIRLALDISKGLAYLHSMGIFHRDLTAKNCLVRVATKLGQKKRYSAVVADLGLAEKIPTKQEERARLRVVGTPYCMAPEVLHEKPYDEKSDFFSLGLIICQLIIRTPPDPEKLPRSNDFGLKRDLFSALAKNGVGAPEMATGTRPLTTPPGAFQQLAYDCCEVDPSKRPGVQEIVGRLEQVSKQEKIERSERKELLLRDAPGLSKRHSLALTDLSSAKHRAVHESRAGVQFALLSTTESLNVCGEITGKPTSPTPDRLMSSGSSACSRLSRSSSDVSKELISHAASIIASSQKTFSSDAGQADDDMSSVLHSLNEAFTNPFDALAKSELQEPKLYDLPSSEVLEMTFDLPAPKLSSGPSLRSGVRNSRVRPKSLLLDFDPSEPSSTQPVCGLLSPRLPTPEPAYVTPHLSNFCGNSSSDGSDAATATSLDATDEASRRMGLKQALIRCVAFSPQGRRLLSWWHNHSRSSDWRSLASVLAVMTEKMSVSKRSISVPDLSRDAESLFALSHDTVALSGGSSSSRSSVSSGKESPRSSVGGRIRAGNKLHPQAYPAYVTLPRKQKLRCPSFDTHRKPRHSKTSDAVFQDAGALGVLHEEAAAAESGSAARASPPSRRGASTSPTLSAAEGEIVDDAGALIPVVDRRVAGFENDPCARQENSAAVSWPLNEVSLKVSSGFAGDTYLEVDAGRTASSGESPCTSSDLSISLQSGVASSNRRRKHGGPHARPALEDFASSSAHANGADDCNPRKDSGVEHPYFSAGSNRDSGYNDDFFTTTDHHYHGHACNGRPSHSDGADADASTRGVTSPEFGRRLPGYVGRITPTCKAVDGSDSNVKLVGESH